MEEIKYPLYYNVDNVPIVLLLKGETVVGKIANGRDYPIGKAIVDGYEIARDEYVALSKALYNYEPKVG